MFRRFGHWPALALGVSLACLVSLLASPVRADDAETGAAMCERAIAGGAARSRVPEGVLQAISLTETGRQVGGRLRPWPWAINREGQGYWFARPLPGAAMETLLAGAGEGRALLGVAR